MQRSDVEFRALRTHGARSGTARLGTSPLAAAVLLGLPSGACTPEVPFASAQDSAVSPELRDLPVPRHDPGFREGVALGLYFTEPGATYDGWLWEIARLGADSVSLVVTRTQMTVRDVELRAEPGLTPPDEDVRAAIRTARSLGLEVMLFPIVDVQRRSLGEWRGTLRPADTGRWFASYEEFVLHYATMAEEEGAAVLSVGSELGSMEEFESEWRTIISRVREAYSGEVLYSANWDRFERTPFWDAVDTIGISAYFELGSDPASVPAPDALDAAWAPHVEAVRALSAGSGRPVVFTEIGYPSQTHAAAEPWNYVTGGEPDPGAQLELYRSLFRAWCDEPALRGVYFWNWFGEGGPADPGYSPRHKPAEQVIRHWFIEE